MAAVAVEPPLVPFGAGEMTSITPQPHPQTAEIIRQVEFYLSDDNLKGDRHLLGLFKEGKGTVSLNEILGFKAMRKYKPKSAVRDAVRQSKLVIVSEDGKRLSRKYPLNPAKITVIPEISRDRKKVVVPEDKPWLTKGMMKPTGFEAGITNGPIHPEEFEKDRKEYDQENAFTERIERAIARFCAGRKMHQTTRKIFEKFMNLGGMDSNQRQFIGGPDKSMEDYTKKEIAEMTSYYGVSERVLDGIYVDEGEEAKWIVDFEAVAKSFFSVDFLTWFDWYDDDTVKTATNVLRNFYNYLLLHDVCPEYRDQLLAARKICDLAEQELPRLRDVDRSMPGDFSKACSSLFGGNYTHQHASAIRAGWYVHGDDLGWNTKDAELVFSTALFAHGTEEQITQIEKANAESKGIASLLEVVSTEADVGLEVTGIELADVEAMSIYSSPLLTDTAVPVKPMGKLYCKRWQIPHAAPRDLPPHLMDPNQQVDNFEFLIEDATLKSCMIGMKMECCVKELDCGIKWIDYVEKVYPSFHIWLPNAEIRALKEPGPPKAWMLRSMGKEAAEADGVEGEEEDEEDEMPD